MIDFSDIITPEGVDAALAAGSKKLLFQHLGGAAARRTGLDAKDITAALAEREKESSTGVGGGVAIPHARLPGLSGIVGHFARLNAPLQYQSVDRLPVDLVFMLLSPSEAGAEHLKVLARISRALRDKQVVAKLRGARSRDAIYAVLTGAETRDAA